MIKADMDLLQKCIKKHLICRIERARIDLRPMFCVPFEISDCLLAVHFVEDFLYNGIKIIRIEDITKVKLNEPEKFLQMIFDDLCTPLPKLDGTVELGSFPALFEGSSGLLVAVECEELWLRSFNLGIFRDCECGFAQLHCVDSSGKWGDYCSSIPIKKITCVTIASRYQQIFSEYV